MDSSKKAHSHSPSHDASCACDHRHDHGHSHAAGASQLFYRWLLSVLFLGGMLFLLKPFIVAQMLVRVSSYSVDSSYNDAIRMCQKIIAIDKDNIKAWTSLGYAYRDLSQNDRAITVFHKVLLLNPNDKGAASFELGRAYYAMGDYPRAIASFERLRSAGSRAAAILEADVLKYRHGKQAYRSLKSMQTLLGELADCYKQTGNTVLAKQIQDEYETYKNKHSKNLFE